MASLYGTLGSAQDMLEGGGVLVWDACCPRGSEMVFLVRAPSPEGRVGLSRRQLKASPSAVARSAALLEANNLDFARCTERNSA